MDGTQVMKQYSSIKNRLLYYLLLTMLVGILPAFGLSFYFAYQEAEEFQDDTLKQVAKLHMSGLTNTESTHPDNEYKLSVFRLSDDKLPHWLTPELAIGFHTLTHDDQTIRLWVGENSEHQRFAIIQPTSERDEIALDSALRTLVPLLILLPLMGAIIWLGIKRELQSVERLALKIDALVDGIPQALPDQTVPKELQGFMLAINHLLTRLHLLFMRQQRFIADAAHELRTPLAALSLQVQNLERATTLIEFKARIQPLKSGVERSQRLAEQLLDLNRSQVQPYTKHTLKIQPFIFELLSLYWPAAEAKKQQLILNADDIILCSHAEALMLILGNALDNAIKYAPEHSNITLRVVIKDNDILIEVENQGSIQRPIEQVFEPFVRATDSDTLGNGLGLSIAKAAATQLQATISLDNTSHNERVVFTLKHPKGNC